VRKHWGLLWFEGHIVGHKTEREAAPAQSNPNSTRVRRCARLRMPSPEFHQATRTKSNRSSAGARNLYLLIRSEVFTRKIIRAGSTAWTAPTIPSARRRSSGAWRFVWTRRLVAPRIGDAHLQTRGRMAGAGDRPARAGIQRVLFKENSCRRTGHARATRKASLLDRKTQRTGGQCLVAGATSENRVEGISSIRQSERRVDTVWQVSLRARGLWWTLSPRKKRTHPSRRLTLRFSGRPSPLARLTPPLESARGLSRKKRRAHPRRMEEASPHSVCMLLSSVSQYERAKANGRSPHLMRLSESIIFEFSARSFQRLSHRTRPSSQRSIA